MIISFKDKELRNCYLRNGCEKVKTDLQRRVLRKLDWINTATCIEDLRNLPSNIHDLKGEYLGFSAISVSGAWRLIFRFVDGNAYDVELLQYH
jgi:proteic killer suppression protein